MKKPAKKKSNAGRKPAADPKIHLNIYMESSIVEAHGGKASAQDKASNYLRETKP